MSKMVCKYNFQNSEKFNGEPYCCLFNEKCKDLSFVCDKNCQVYEDYKQLEELKAENLGLKILHESDKDLLKSKEQECEKKSWEIGNLGYKIKNQRKEINIRLEQLDQLKTENEELKKQNNQLDNGINEQFSKIVELEGRNNLLKAILTEIKEIMKKHCRKCKKHKFYHFQLCCTCKYTDILQKISEVKHEQRETTTSN